MIVYDCQLMVFPSTIPTAWSIIAGTYVRVLLNEYLVEAIDLFLETVDSFIASKYIVSSATIINTACELYSTWLKDS